MKPVFGALKFYPEPKLSSIARQMPAASWRVVNIFVFIFGSPLEVFSSSISKWGRAANYSRLPVKFRPRGRWIVMGSK